MENIVKELSGLVKEKGVDMFAFYCDLALSGYRDEKRNIRCDNDATKAFRKELENIHEKRGWKYID